MKKYFVSYVWRSGKQSGQGMVEIKMSSGIESYDDVKEIKKYLDGVVKDKDGDKCDCIVMFFKELQD